MSGPRKGWRSIGRSCYHRRAFGSYRGGGWSNAPFLGWGQKRRMSKDYGRPPGTSEALIYLEMRRLMVRRLARGRGLSDRL